MKFGFDTDEDTERLLEITAHFLQEYFGYGEEQAVRLINVYHDAHKVYLDDNGWGDDFYHHEGAFRVAALLHWTESKDEDSDYTNWLKSKNLLRTPRAAVDYIRIHYFKGRVEDPRTDSDG